jgi:hypothetical protein
VVVGVTGGDGEDVAFLTPSASVGATLALGDRKAARSDEPGMTLRRWSGSAALRVLS